MLQRRKYDRKIVHKILDLKNLDLEIIIVDDNSTRLKNIIETKIKNRSIKLYLMIEIMERDILLEKE